MSRVLACALAVLAFVAFVAVYSPDKLARVPLALLFRRRDEQVPRDDLGRM